MDHNIDSLLPSRGCLSEPDIKDRSNGNLIEIVVAAATGQRRRCELEMKACHGVYLNYRFNQLLQYGQDHGGDCYAVILSDYKASGDMTFGQTGAVGGSEGKLALAIIINLESRGFTFDYTPAPKGTNKDRHAEE